MTHDNSEIYQKCPNPDCAFEGNLADATLCEFCFTPLKTKAQQQLCDKVDKPTKLKSDFSTKKAHFSFFLQPTFFNKKVIYGVLLVLSATATGLYFKQESSLFKRNSIVEAQSYRASIIPKMSELIVPEGTFNYGGSICFAALRREGMNAAIKEAHPNFELKHIEQRGNAGCSAGIEMLLNKELSFATNARPLTQADRELAKKKGIELESIPIAIDGIVVYVNKSLNIKSLSLKQLQDIHLGKITNWREVGGADLSITVVSLEPKTDEILQLLTGIDNFSLNERVKIVRDYTTAIREVNSTPGAISSASTAILKGQSSIRPLALRKEENSSPISALLADGSVNLSAFSANLYPLTRQLTVVIRKDGTLAEKAGLAYAKLLTSQEGQAITKKAGFVPIDLVR